MIAKQTGQITHPEAAFEPLHDMVEKVVEEVLKKFDDTKRWSPDFDFINKKVREAIEINVEVKFKKSFVKLRKEIVQEHRIVRVSREMVTRVCVDCGHDYRTPRGRADSKYKRNDQCARCAFPDSLNLKSRDWTDPNR